MTRYYCSGFDVNNAFGHGLGEMFKRELTDTKNIVFVLGGADKIENEGKVWMAAKDGVRFQFSGMSDKRGLMKAYKYIVFDVDDR